MNTATLETEKLIYNLRRGWFKQATENLHEIERISHYGTGSPDWQGISNLCHIIHFAITDHLNYTGDLQDDQRGFKNLCCWTDCEPYPPTPQGET